MWPKGKNKKRRAKNKNKNKRHGLAPSLSLSQRMDVEAQAQHIETTVVEEVRDRLATQPRVVKKDKCEAVVDWIPPAIVFGIIGWSTFVFLYFVSVPILTDYSIAWGTTYISIFLLLDFLTIASYLRTVFSSSQVPFEFGIAVCERKKKKKKFTLV